MRKSAFKRGWFGVLFICLGCLGAAVPASASSPTGPPTTVEGILDIVQVDDFEAGTTERHYWVQDTATKKRWRLRFDEVPPGQIRSGSRIRVRGRSGRSVGVPTAASTDEQRRAAHVLHEWSPGHRREGVGTALPGGTTPVRHGTGKTSRLPWRADGGSQFHQRLVEVARSPAADENTGRVQEAPAFIGPLT